MANYFSGYNENVKSKTASDGTVNVSNNYKASKGSFFKSYTETLPDDVKKKLKEQSDLQVQQKQKADDSKAAEAKRQANKSWFDKGMEGVGKAFTTDLGKNLGNIISDGSNFVKESVVDPVARVVQQSNVSGQIQSKNNGSPVVGDNFAKNQNTEIDRALKAGEINKQKADQLRAKTTTAVTKTKQSISSAEKNVGVKYDPSAGVEGIIDTVGNLGGTEGIIKGSVKLAEKTGTSLFNKLTGKKVVEDVIEKTADVHPVVQKTTIKKSTNIDKPTIAYHGSTNPNLTELKTGVSTGLNEKRNLVYLSDDESGAKPYTKLRGEGGLGVLNKSETGKVYKTQVTGSILDGQNETSRAALKNLTGYNELPGKMKNMLTNPTGIDGALLEANPDLVSFLKNNGYTAVRSHLPNGGGSKELIVVNPDKLKLVNGSLGAKARAENYKTDTTKIRVTSEEAQQKLVKAGYTTDESKKILEDVLPEKGLSMPGSPKHIGYNEDKILAAANEFDKTPSIREMSGNKVTDDIASQYKSVDDYVNQSVDRTWANNKKGAGTDIVYKHENDIGTGSDSLQGTRISNNDPYYRAVFEETGKAPTKARIKQDITEFLDGKDNAARHLLDPEERGVVDLLREREASLATKDKVPEAAVVADGSNVAPLASVDGTAEKGVSKLALSVRQTAIKDKLLKKSEFDDEAQPSYIKANKDQQISYAVKLVEDDPQRAIDIAMGRVAPPEHILRQHIFNAVEENAKSVGGEKGGRLLKELSENSSQSENLTRMGQEIEAAKYRDPHSPVTMMNEVKLARIEAAKARGKDLSKAIKEDAKIVKESTPKVKKEDWDSFIKGLEC